MPYSVEQMFDLVADVKSYADFLPWVVGVRVRKDTPEEMIADLLVGFKALRERFTSRVIKARPGSISVEYVEGPLKFLRNEWRFSRAEGGGAVVDFMVDFEFRNRLFEAVAGQMFGVALTRMIGAFEARAAAIYDVATPSGSSSSSAFSAA